MSEESKKSPDISDKIGEKSGENRENIHMESPNNENKSVNIGKKSGTQSPDISTKSGKQVPDTPKESVNESGKQVPDTPKEPKVIGRISAEVPPKRRKVSPKSLQNLKKGSRKPEKKTLQSPDSLPDNSPKGNNKTILYVGIGIGILIGGLGIYHLWNQFKSKKVDKVDNNPQLELTPEEQERLKKIEQAKAKWQ